jgi:hypothetical protein
MTRTGIRTERPAVSFSVAGFRGVDDFLGIVLPVR